MLTKSMLYAVGLVTAYIMIVCVISSLTSRTTTARQNVCAIVGLLLGGFIATPFFGINKLYGFIAIGVGVVIMYLLLYTGFIRWLIGLIPESIRRFFRTLVRVMEFVVVSALIVLLVVLVGGFLA